jgi:ribosomal protein L7/L12
LTEASYPCKQANTNIGEWKMKLDRLKFGKLVAHVVSNGMSQGDREIEKLDELAEFDVPTHNVRVSENDVNELLIQISSPDGFIPAIKAYRVLTGVGLKEAKEAIERYRTIPKFPQKVEPKEATLGDILGQATKK